MCKITRIPKEKQQQQKKPSKNWVYVMSGSVLRKDIVHCHGCCWLLQVTYREFYQRRILTDILCYDGLELSKSLLRPFEKSCPSSVLPKFFPERIIWKSSVVDEWTPLHRVVKSWASQNSSATLLNYLFELGQVWWTRWLPLKLFLLVWYWKETVPLQCCCEL